MGLGIAAHGARKLFGWFGGGGINGTGAYCKGSNDFGPFNAVAEPRRREILNYLALQERAVGDIVVGLKMEQPSVSKHLRAPQNVGLVRVRRDGRHIFYRTNAEAIRPLHEWTKAFEELWQHQYWRKERPEAKQKCCCQAAFGIARQRDADRTPWRVGGHIWRCLRSAESR